MLLFFFFNDTATTEIYTLSLHDALPISPEREIPLEPQENKQLALQKAISAHEQAEAALADLMSGPSDEDRKSTRLNSSHANISYAVFCLKKKTFSPLAALISPLLTTLAS